MATDFDLNERAVLAMMARLNTNLNGVIDQINAERSANTTPAYVLSHPAAVLDAPPAPHQLVQFPIVAIADGDLTLTDDVGWGATGTYQMTILAYVADPDPRALAWKLRRYGQALITVALQGRNMDGGGYGTRLLRVRPGQRLSRQDPQGSVMLMSWVGVDIEVFDEQNTG